MAGTTKLFVCYFAVTTGTERFCQNAFAPREADNGGLPLAVNSAAAFGAPLELPPTTPQHPSGATGRQQLTDVLRLIKGRLSVICAMNTQEHRRAHAAFELCYSLEQRRDLGSHPTFIALNIPLNAELVACRASNVGVFLSRSACNRS
jgi:hypothetical protein